MNAPNDPKGRASLASRKIERPAAATRAAARKRIADAVRGGTPTDTKRFLLPSCRVAEFEYPTIGEYLKLNERAVLLAAREHGEKATGVDMAYYVKEAALRRLLVGLTNVPVPVVMKPGWDEEKARDGASEVINTLAMDKVRTALKLPPDAEDLPENWDSLVQVEFDRLVANGAVQREVFRQRLEFEDVAATLAAANIQPVTSSDFDDVDHYLRQIQNARVGTPEADDLLALHGVTGRIVAELDELAEGATFGGPKVEGETTTNQRTAPRRPCRS